MFHFCNCKEDNPKRYTNKFRIVKVDDDGICINCGHYAMNTDKQMHYVSNVENSSKKGKKHDDSVIETIIELLDAGHRNKDIAEKMNVSRSMVSLIKTNRIRN